MLLPRAHSDPGGQRHDSKWTPVHSPESAAIQYPLPLRHPVEKFHHHRITPLYIEPPSSVVPPPNPQVVSYGVNTEVVGEPVVPHPPKRPLWLTILLAPYLAVEYCLKSWCSPSPECMRCVQISYWMVIMISGILTLVVAMSPKKS